MHKMEICSTGGAQAFRLAYAPSISAGLYSNQRLAVASERLQCLERSHSGGDCLTSFIITITEDKIVIPDFDSGIAPDMMGPLYGAYGGSEDGEEPNQPGSACS